MKAGQTYTIEPMINAGVVSFLFFFRTTSLLVGELCNRWLHLEGFC